MFINVTFVILMICIKSSVSLWLPKCCPSGMQISGDGKSCVKGSFGFNDTETNTTALEELTVFIDYEKVVYTLKHVPFKLECARRELYVIKDDIFVTPENDVVIFDDIGANWTLKTTELCVDSVYIPQDGDITSVFFALICPSCLGISCVHKCCSDDKQLLISEGGNKVDCIKASRDASWSEEFWGDRQQRPFVIHGFPECSNSLYLKHLDRLPTFIEQSHLRVGRTIIPRTEYCGDFTDRGHALLGCRQSLPASITKPILYGELFCLGALFLGFTLVLHFWLPELRKTLHSRIVVAHVACLLVGYVGLAVVNLAPLPAPSPICSTAAFTIQFSILAAIFWLNIMCVDIAWTFSGLRAPKASLTLDSDGHKFLYYSLYAWGSTAAISGVTAFLEYSPIIPHTSKFKPSFGVMRCWFQDWESILLLVYGPMGVLLLVNIALFVYTAIKIHCTQRDTANYIQQPAGSRLCENRDRFALYLKLFGLMGITWVFEVVSWSVGGPDSYWYITDVINALRSLFIFALFCLKKKVYILIKAKLSMKEVPKFPVHPRKSTTSSRMTSSMTSQRTNSLQLSQISSPSPNP